MSLTQSHKEGQHCKSVTVGDITTYIKSRLWSFHDFDLRRTIGTGTYSRVRIVNIKGNMDQTPFALKILTKSELIRLKQIEHAKAERYILTMIEHPLIVKLHTTFQDERRIGMLMEYVSGGELFQYLRKQGRLPNEVARFYASEIVLVIGYLHTLQIAYRDVKPENILIDSEGYMKLTDFGFAKIVEDRTWTLCGTPDYLAPEIIQSRGHGRAVDWWALGILIFEMLAGYPPFYNDNTFGIYQNVLAGRIDFPRHFDVKAKDLIKRLLTHDRSKRIGCLKHGTDDIKKHRWYKGVDWDLLLNRHIPPPFVPNLKSVDDTSMFATYMESAGNSAPSISAKDQELFESFTPEFN